MAKLPQSTACMYCGHEADKQGHGVGCPHYRPWNATSVRQAELLTPDVFDRHDADLSRAEGRRLSLLPGMEAVVAMLVGEGKLKGQQPFNISISAPMPAVTRRLTRKRTVVERYIDLQVRLTATVLNYRPLEAE